ncbi:MAG: MATE family efflux transporter [Oscillospiraceae bacterium]
MLPVILQQLITIGINFLDNLMIGSFGETSIAAAAFGNQVYSFFQFICMGLGSGAVVMSSQFWGRKETDPMRVTAAMALRVTAAICAAFTLLTVAWPAAALRIFTSDAAVIAVGAPYMRLIGTTFLLAGLSSTATYLMRSVGRVNIPLIGSAIAFFLNLFFNWVFIFGKLGAPRLELVGAAIGTIIARTFEFLFVFGYFILKEKNFAFRFRHLLLPGGSLKREYSRYSLPVLFSDTLLGLSLALTSVIYGHISAEISAAVSIANSLIQLITILNVGMAGASAIVVGNTIGEGDIPRAKREGNTYILLSFLFGLVMIIPLALLEGPYTSLYTIQAETASIVHDVMLCNYFMLPLQTIAYVISKGVLRGGGDTRFLLLADSSCVWFISLPLGALAGFVWHLSPFWVYFLLRLEFPLKGIVCFIRYCTGRWIKEIKAH